MSHLYPLTEANRAHIAQVFSDVPRRDIAIDCVLEGTTGTVGVDDVSAPTVYQMMVTDLFTYFAGDASTAAARDMVAALPGFRLIISAAPGWMDLIREIHGEQVHEVDRYSFSSAALDANQLQRLLTESPRRGMIQRIRTEHVAYWSADPEQRPYTYLGFASFEDFLARGIAFGAFDGEDMVGAAWSSLAHPRAIEVSIVVEETYRQQGIATALAAALLSEALAQGRDPHWDAANPVSCKLALKLGYKMTGDYIALFLPAPPPHHS